MIINISHIMKQDVFTVHPFDGLRKSQQIMLENKISCLPVIEDNKLIGLLTLQDILSSHPNRIVADAMDLHIISVHPHYSLWAAKELFEQHNIENLPVTEDNMLHGLVTKASLYSELGKYMDLLTGLYQRHYLYDRGIELLKKGAKISIIFIDINKFGSINKEHGHVIGDTIIKEMSRLLKNHIPDDCVLCRYGGDEFAVLSAYPLEACKKLAINILISFSQYSFCNNITISACAGIAIQNTTADPKPDDLLETLYDLINMASLASTQAKSEGENIVVVGA